MNARSQPALAGVDAPLPQFPLWQVHAGELAPIVRQRDQGGLVADVPEIHAQVGFPAEQFPQLRNRESMTRVHANNRRAVREKLVYLGFQHLSKILELRS